MSRDYWLGLFTLPAVGAAGWLVGWTFATIVTILGRLGFTASIRWRRGIDEVVSEYTLRHGIWWERSFGPIFVGGWYREEMRYQQPRVPRLGRWIGIGRTEGPCVIVFRTRNV